MKLHSFIQSLVENGKVTIGITVQPFDTKDESATIAFLREHYATEALELPGKAPEFDASAALWSAKYFYHAVLFTVSREIPEEVVKEHLHPFETAATASAISSADLIFRHLHNLISLTKNLAPGDILVQLLNVTAGEWLYSSASVAQKISGQEKTILDHPSLRISYIDRIIKTKNHKLLSAEVKKAISELMGEKINQYWPGWESIINIKENESTGTYAD